MNKRIINRIALVDEPTSEDHFKGRGHERTANALAKAISSARKREDKAIGLDGRWGSGKSSVVEMAKKKLKSIKEEPDLNLHFFTYDIWKSQGSSFRRSFLEHFVKWCEDEFPDKSRGLRGIMKKISGKTIEIENDTRPILDWYGIGVLFLLPFLPIYYFWAKNVFDAVCGNKIAFLWSLPACLLYILIFVTLGYAKYREKASNESNSKSGSKLDFKSALSQTLLLNSKQFQAQNITQHIREVNPDDFEFQSLFREILTKVQTETIKIVIIFDNIDRLPVHEIQDKWSMVRSVFARGTASGNSIKNDSIVAIVPFDRHLICPVQISTSDDQVKGLSKSNSLTSRELLSKTFDEIISISPPVMSNSRELFKEKIQKALPDFGDDDALFRAYLIYSRSKVVELHGAVTPRQIIAFINELTGLYALHEGQFGLPTVATFMHFRDELDANPSELNKGDFVDTKIREIAADDELDRNLAAMAFNVEPSLAFQILLDPKIAAALVSKNPEEIKTLSTAPGFDLRINEVVSDNVSGWVTSGEFGVVVNNIVELLKTFSKDASSHIRSTLLGSFKTVKTLSLGDNSHAPFLSFLDVCPQPRINEFISHLLKCVVTEFSKSTIIDGSHGERFFQFLNELKAKLAGKHEPTVLFANLKNLGIPSDAEFLFGLASKTFNSDFGLRHFKKPDIAISDDNPDFLTKAALEKPEASFRAFSEFQSVKLLKNEQWVRIFNELNASLNLPLQNDLEIFSFQLALFTRIWGWLDVTTRKEIDLNGIFTTSQFYVNLREADSADQTKMTLPNALFLAKQAGWNFENGESIDSTVRDWFAEYYNGSTKLEPSQILTIACNAKNSLVVTSWLQSGKEDFDNLFLQAVNRSCMKLDPLPGIALETFLECFPYFQKIMDADLNDLVVNYGKSSNAAKTENINIEQIPSGFVKISHGKDGWQSLHDRIKKLLNDIPCVDWDDYLVEASDEFKVLCEAVQFLEFKFASLEFRKTFEQFALKILDGSNVIDSHRENYDCLLKAIDTAYHAETFRNIRERMNVVSADALKRANLHFPVTLEKIVTFGDRIKKREKDSIVRNILCTALEGNVESLLDIFLSIGRAKVDTLIKESEESTKSKKDGAWERFSKIEKNREKIQKIYELLFGKKQAKSYFDMFWDRFR